MSAPTKREIIGDTAVDRLIKALSVLVIGTVAAGGMAWLFLIARHPGVEGSAECRAEYQRAHSAADSAVVDARIPVSGRTKEPNPPTCGTLRRTGELR